MGFCAYRDRFDSKVTEKFDLSVKVDLFKNALNNLKATGGADTAEDVISGVQELKKLKWRKYASKVVIHVADSPCHGKRYHEGCSDNYEDGDYKGRSLV